MINVHTKLKITSLGEILYSLNFNSHNEIPTFATVNSFLKVYRLKPNLFQFATKELSQDAVIAWLASWASDSNKVYDTAIHDTAKFFISSLYAKSKTVNCPNYITVRVHRQMYKIDVVLELTHGSTTHAIAIEDKTNSQHHSDQLKRYVGQMKDHKYDGKNNYSSILYIYFKTGFQEDLSEAKKQGFEHYSAQDFFKVLTHGKSLNIDNDIFVDAFQSISDRNAFYSECEKDFLTYASKLVCDWTKWNWIGFFFNNRNSFNAQYSIVPNNRGELLAFYFGSPPVTSKADGLSYKLYIDIQFAGKAAISYRMNENKQSKDMRTARNSFISAIEPLALNLGIQGRIPKFTKAEQTREVLRFEILPQHLDEKKLITLLNKLRKILTVI